MDVYLMNRKCENPFPQEKDKSLNDSFNTSGCPGEDKNTAISHVI